MTPTPLAELCSLVEQTPGTVLLEGFNFSVPNFGNSPIGQAPGPYSRLFTAPIEILQAQTPADVPALFANLDRAAAAGLFAAGFLGYEAGSSFEPSAGFRGAPSTGNSSQPLAWFGLYPGAYIFDHSADRFIGEEPPGWQQRNSVPASSAHNQDAALELDDQALNEADYARSIAEIHDWIRSGDVYQLNYTLPLRLRTTARPAALYQRLRRHQPVDYGAFLHTHPGSRILCFSPELFFRIEAQGRRIVTQPMKGTAPRGRTTAEDREHSQWLANDPKNRAENVMIVDLLRNDLGRLCRFGSVRAEQLFALQRHPTLWQMTSTVSGTLCPEVDFQQIFRALFPCGSITGAPKVRAMQLIAQLEATPRGVYTGAIGFLSRDETVFNVAIRTLELQEHGDTQTGKMGIGSGIVIDSDPASERQECLLKAAFLTASNENAPKDFSLLESLLWNGDYPRLQLHLERLADSAEYFGFPCKRAEIQAALFAHADSLERRSPRKVRLLLPRDGAFEIESEILPDTGNAAEPVRLCISPHRTDARHRMLFHKTTHRPLYSKALKTAQAAGFDEVLFFNQQGELTEGAISNVWIEKGGRLLTPPIQCGLLAGVERRHLLATLPNATEQILTLDDLHHADAIYLSNAVRGLRRATLSVETFFN